jgi:branched-subunit amino acid ABC-type transport system permease component
MSLLDFVNFHLAPGLVLGSIYALGAIGITLVFGVMRYAHLAHGDLATLGAFTALAVVWGLGVSPWLGLPVAMALAAGVAILCDRLFYAHLRKRPLILTVIASLGVALMLRSLVQIGFGADAQVYSRGIVRPDEYFGVRLRDRELLTFAVAIGLVIALQLFLARTRWGKAMRAMSDNPDLARLSGVDVGKVTAMTWAVVGALAAASGFFLGLNTELRSMMGWNMLLPMFAAAILGGVGRVEGALLGGLIVGVLEETAVLFLPAQYKSAMAFAVLLLMLTVRPTGLLRGKVL